MQRNEALIAARAATDYTQSDVAQAIGISLRHYQRLEAGARLKDIDLLERLARVLGTPYEPLRKSTINSLVMK